MIDEENEAREFIKHRARDNLIGQYAHTFGLSRRAANEEFVAHIENDPDSPVFTTSAGKPRKRPRKLLADAHA